jgi:hypothetical protein
LPAIAFIHRPTGQSAQGCTDKSAEDRAGGAMASDFRAHDATDNAAGNHPGLFTRWRRGARTQQAGCQRGCEYPSLFHCSSPRSSRRRGFGVTYSKVKVMLGGAAVGVVDPHQARRSGKIARTKIRTFPALPRLTISWTHAQSS